MRRHITLQEIIFTINQYEDVRAQVICYEEEIIEIE